MDTLDGVDLDGDVVMERDGNDAAEDNEEKKDENKEDEEEEVVVVDEDKEEDKDDDDGKEPWTIGQGEMVNILADDVDTMVDHWPIVLPEQGHKMCEHTPREQPPPPAARPLTPDPHP